MDLKSALINNLMYPGMILLEVGATEPYLKK